MPITVAITGAAGQIGSALRAGLTRKDFRICAIDVVPIIDAGTAKTTRGSLIFETPPPPRAHSRDRTPSFTWQRTQLRRHSRRFIKATC